MEAFLAIIGLVSIVFVIKFLEKAFKTYSDDRLDNIIKNSQKEYDAELAAREAAMTPEEKANREKRKKNQEIMNVILQNMRRSYEITELKQNAEIEAKKAAELAAIPKWEWTRKPRKSIIFKAERDAYYSSPEWRDKRIIMLARAKNTCNRCHVMQSSGLHVHHKTYENFGNEKMSDLEVLCEPCHEKHHNKKFYYD
ncbi:HNH endonuclease [Belliella sp. DSM 111904]|uniref:HNH endonuclease n=1 Tax=Belliella filtrata TaxID=2923435 RepID=A0ABS9V174_9BACT|nr:HNH endonuclease signature motif containing protein [Belliella filtrata]MCH7410167.1 HNH endonuclease [Belliella filtrata]